jgi:hypothetical protein
MCTKNALPTRKKEQAPNQRAEVSHHYHKEFSKEQSEATPPAMGRR